MSQENTPDYSELSTPENFNPFDEPVIQREYTKPKVSYDPATIQSIPEPLYQQPNLDELQEDDYEDDKPASKKVKPSKPKKGFDSDDPFVNQDLQDYSKKDADESASLMVDTFLEGYKVAHTFGQKYFTLSEEEIVKKAIKGEINPDMRIPISQTKTISVHEFIGEYNRQVTEVLVVEDEFIESVRPVMIRVFSSRGYGLTDEQFLMVAFGKDIVQKGAQLYTFKKSLTQSLKMMTEMYNSQVNPEFNSPPQEQRPQGTPPPKSPPPQSPPPQSPPPQEPNPSQEPNNSQTLNEEDVFGGLPKEQPNMMPPPSISEPIETNENFQDSNLEETVEEEMIPQYQQEVTMHDDMEDEISAKPKRRRGRPKKKMRLEPTEEETKTTIIEAKVESTDLNKGFDMSDAMETEEK